MARFEFYASTGYVGCAKKEIVEIPDEELKGKTEEEIEDYVNEEYYLPWLWDNIDSGFSKI